MQHSPAQAAEVMKTRVQQVGNPGNSTTKLSTLGSVDSSPVSLELAIGRILVSTFVRLFKLMSILVQVKKPRSAYTFILGAKYSPLPHSLS